MSGSIWLEMKVKCRLTVAVEILCMKHSLCLSGSVRETKIDQAAAGSKCSCGFGQLIIIKQKI